MNQETVKKEDAIRQLAETKIDYELAMEKYQTIQVKRKEIQQMEILYESQVRDLIGRMFHLEEIIRQHKKK